MANICACIAPSVDAYGYQNCRGGIEIRLLICRNRCTLAWTLAFGHHHGLLEKMWKRDLKNHAHDRSVVVRDKVHREIVARFELAEDMADNLIRFYSAKLPTHAAERRRQSSCLTHARPREEVIDTTVRLRASQFNLRDDRGQPVRYFIRHAREI